MNPVPSVAMNDGTRSATVMNPLAKPAATPHEQRKEDRQDRRDAVEVDQVVHEERREGEDEPHRQVYLAADQQEHLTDGDDRTGAVICEMLTMLSLVRKAGEARQK